MINASTRFMGLLSMFFQAPIALVSTIFYLLQLLHDSTHGDITLWIKDEGKAAKIVLIHYLLAPQKPGLPRNIPGFHTPGIPYAYPRPRIPWGCCAPCFQLLWDSRQPRVPLGTFQVV